MKAARAIANVVAIAAVVAVVAFGSTARASSVQPLSPAQLADGAERVVSATVTDLRSRWSADHTRHETVVALATHDGDALTLVQPGGELGGVRQIVVGMPDYRRGERARFYLRHNADGTTWRVYGWAQGKWPERVIAGAPVYLPGPLADTAAFATNGMVWPAARMPVPYLLNQIGSDDLSLAQIRDAVHAAFGAWQDVPCAALSFTDAGDTDLGVAIDGQNVILFIESGWIYGAEAAGATALTIIDGQQTADVAINGENYHWAIGPSGALAAGGTLDLQGVLTHELGHFSGLGHTMSAHDTMYYSWTPWAGQRTPSLDDKLGLCAIYSVAGDECASDPDCGAGATCATTASGKLCDRPADPIGAPCDYDLVECGDFCLFTKADLSTGYCSRFCASNADCPPTHHCAAASAGSNTVLVCFAGAQPAPDAAIGGCTLDDQCPAGQYCGGEGACTLDCRTANDCGGAATCDPRGRCATGGGDTGCCGAGGGASGALLAIAMIALRPRRQRAVKRSTRTT
ncbi:MAG: matrixin family metalloprotease [Deltaproteobacteria bacterium]|nr:matrixin family metalloprotease [Deltaproteobacteria bacterium]